MQCMKSIFAELLAAKLIIVNLSLGFCSELVQKHLEKIRNHLSCGGFKDKVKHSELVLLCSRNCFGKISTLIDFLQAETMTLVSKFSKLIFVGRKRITRKKFQSEVWEFYLHVKLHNFSQFFSCKHLDLSWGSI